MPRWLWFLPLGLMLLTAGILGYRYGWIWVNMTRSEAAAIWADHYVQQSGGDAASCVAMPGEDVWLALKCGGGDAVWVYRISRFGQLVTLKRGADGA